MADFYDYLDDLDLDFDPDDPTDPLNALLEQIREDMEDTSPKAYVLNEENLKKFMIVYKNLDLLVEAEGGEFKDIRTDPREMDFSITVEFPYLGVALERMILLKRAVVSSDSLDISATTSGTVRMAFEIRNVYTRIKIST